MDLLFFPTLTSLQAEDNDEPRYFQSRDDRFFFLDGGRADFAGRGSFSYFFCKRRTMSFFPGLCLLSRGTWSRLGPPWRTIFVAFLLFSLPFCLRKRVSFPQHRGQLFVSLFWPEPVEGAERGPSFLSRLKQAWGSDHFFVVFPLRPLRLAGCHEDAFLKDFFPPRPDYDLWTLEKQRFSLALRPDPPKTPFPLFRECFLPRRSSGSCTPIPLRPSYINLIDSGFFFDNLSAHHRFIAAGSYPFFPVRYRTRKALFFLNRFLAAIRKIFFFFLAYHFAMERPFWHYSFPGRVEDGACESTFFFLWSK